MSINPAALISFAVVFSGSFALSAQSVEAKTPRNSSSRSRNYFVPPPPPYTPSMASLALGMTYAQALAANADKTLAEKSANPYSKYVVTRNQGDLPQVIQANSFASIDPGAEKKILKHIDDIDFEISNTQKEIGKLLNL